MGAEACRAHALRIGQCAGKPLLYVMEIPGEADSSRMHAVWPRKALREVGCMHCRRDGVLSSLRCTIAQLRCHDASVSRLKAAGMPLLVEQLLQHWHP